MIAPELADDPKFIRRFEAEAQIVAGLEHPHIVPLYDYWREPRAAYLVMRLIGDSSLADALADGALPPGRAASVFAQLASALQSAHRSGVVHRDVKPENILIDRDGNAYLTDFGMAFASRRGGIAAADSSIGASLERAVRVARAARRPSDVARVGRVQLGGRRREGAHRADRRLRGDSRGSAGRGAHGARPRHRQRPTPPVLERGGLRPGPHRSARRRSHGAARRCCDREPVQGVAGVRGGRRRRLLRARATRRAAHRPARRAGHPWTVRRRRRAERQRQVERRPGGARAGVGGRRVADVAGLVPGRDDTGAPPVRGARSSAQSGRDRSPDRPCSTSSSHRVACGEPSSGCCPTDATSCSW